MPTPPHPYEKTICITLCLRPSERAALRAVAYERDRSMSAIVREFIARELTPQEATR